MRRLFPVLLCLAFVVAACADGDSAANDEPEATTTVTVETTETVEVTTTPPAEASTDTVEPVALRLTFNGESCTYEGATNFTQGPVDLTFVNESEESAAVNLVGINEGYTIQDVIDDLGPEPSTGHHPSWTRELGTWRSTAPGESHLWEGDLEMGLYAMVCVRMSPLGVWFGTGLTVES
jgi:hypothetical protein